MRICVVTNCPLTITETFIRQHVTDLPAKTVLMDSWPPWARSDSPQKRTLLGSAYDRAQRVFFPDRSRQRRITSAYLSFFREWGTETVLAEFGPTGVAVMEACRQLKLPLVVHFHGYDVSVREVLKQYGPAYSLMFRQAAAVIAVSRAMQQKLIGMGAPPERVHYNPCGVKCELFGPARPSEAPPLVLAVGRFVEKKAPQITLAVFRDVLRQYPDARLRMIGDGPLLKECQELTNTLGMEKAVTFLGSQPHEIVAEEMRLARVFVQHSIEAASGDSEGTPVAILEAGASGLPVVSTYHGGITDVVSHNETGLLVKEGDVVDMGRQILRLLRDPELAEAFGHAARQRVEMQFSATRSIDRLWTIIKNCSAAALPQRWPSATSASGRASREANSCCKAEA